MNKMELIAAVAERTDLPKARTAELVEAVLGAIAAALKNHQEVRLLGFGTFATAQRGASKGRNPRSGAEIEIPATVNVKFKAGKGLRDSLN